MEYGNSPGSQRQIPWNSLTFIPVSPEERKRISWDTAVQSDYLCDYCEAVIDTVDQAYHQVQTKTWWENIRQNTILHKRYILYSELYKSACTNCHFCSINVNAVCEAFRGEERVRNAELEMFLGVVPRQQSVLFRFRIARLSDLKDACIIPISNSPRSQMSLQSQSIFTASQECFEIAQDWFEQCLHSHPYCPSYKATWCPTRLIRIKSPSEVCLVETANFDAPVPYYTLSYCWGKQRVLVATKSTYESFKTSIPVENLPLTIQDAIYVVYRLSGPVSYIWIDSLCIVQDDPKDWRREAATMCDVYHNARLTIAALGASGGTEGLFARRDPLAAKTCRVPSKYVLEEAICIDKIGLLGTLKPAYDRAPLHKRGWVFQEKTLSSRMLFFGSYLYWKCESCFEIESVVSNTMDVGFNSSTKDSRAAEEAEIEKREEKATTPDMDGYMKIPEQLVAWRQSVKAFTSCDLTVPSDRLPAILGVITDLERKNGWKNMNGLFIDHLALDLLWMGDWNRRSEDRLLGVPTWSWTSTQTPIRYSDIATYRLIEAIKVKINEQDNKVLNIVGPLVELNLDIIQDQNQNKSWTSWTIKDFDYKHSIWRSNSQLDILGKIPEGPHYFLPLLMVQSHNNPPGVRVLCVGLAMVYSGNSNAYERFGLLSIGIEGVTDVHWLKHGIISFQVV